MGRRLLPDVCICTVSWDASVNVCSEWGVLHLRSIVHLLFCFTYVWGVAPVKKIKSEMRTCRTKLGIVTYYYTIVRGAYTWISLADLLIVGVCTTPVRRLTKLYCIVYLYTRRHHRSLPDQSENNRDLFYSYLPNYGFWAHSAFYTAVNMFWFITLSYFFFISWHGKWIIFTFWEL